VTTSLQIRAVTNGPSTTGGNMHFVQWY